MPEGDTVWHTATILRDALAGKTLTRCDVRVPKFATMDLTGQVVDEVISRGKHLFIRVGHSSIHSHLKMEGSWKVNPLSKPSRAGYRIRIILEAGDIQAAGIDLGVLEVLERDHDMDAVAHLGPDLLGDDWDPHVAAANLVADPIRAAGRSTARPAGDGRRRKRLLQRTVLRHRASAHRSVTDVKDPLRMVQRARDMLWLNRSRWNRTTTGRYPARPRAVGLRPGRVSRAAAAAR